MTLGKAVVASDIGGPREQMEEAVSGMLVAPGDSAALARAICDLLATRRKRAQAIGSPRSSVRERFTSDLFYRRLSGCVRRPRSDSRRP